MNDVESNLNNSINSGNAASIDNSTGSGRLSQQEREQRRATRAAARANDPDDEKKRRGPPRRFKRDISSINTIVFSPFFILFAGMLVVSCLISFFLVFSHPDVDQPTADGAIAARQRSMNMKNNNIGHERLSDAQQMDVMKHGYHVNDGSAAQARREAEEAEQDDDDSVESGDKSGGDLGEDDKADADEAAGDENGGKDDDDDKPAAGSGDGDGGDADDDDGGHTTEVPGDVDPLGVVNKKKTSKKRANHEPKLTPRNYDVKQFDTTLTDPHLNPKFPPLPIFKEIENKEKLIDDLVNNNKPTIAGIIAFFNEYLHKLHAMHKLNSKLQGRDITGQKIDEMFLITSYFNLTKKEVDPLENAYRGRTIFPVREDDSVFISLAAFREHLLGKSLMSAFRKAKNPDKLFFGIVVQNCYGLDGVVCQTGVEVIGQDKNGRPMTSISPKPPDENGVEEFCNDPEFQKYCLSGQIRVIYVHDTDALGPQTARFYASKLWGGETYFMQMDSHLEFAPDWDKYYIDEARACKSYPKAVLSAYPPGFQKYDGEYKGGTPGARLCMCQFSNSPVENHILRISMGGNTPHDAPYPTQIPFIAAGFFFAHASFLKDVPFDPYAPWCFMGEEIALSVRAWTQGWNIYAPRLNMIAHQYRPGRLGLPKFWESVGRDSGRAGLNTRMQRHVLRRVKHLIGYTTDSEEKLLKDGDMVALTNFKHYSMGRERSLEEYLELTNIDVVEESCHSIPWCMHSDMQ